MDMSGENKKQSMNRTICVDGDALDIVFFYDEEWGVWIGQYPFFKEEPRYTPAGKPWRNVTYTGCKWNTNAKYNDCGSCDYLLRERHSDLIGVCCHKGNMKKKG